MFPKHTCSVTGAEQEWTVNDMAENKACPIMICSCTSAMCIGKQCAWWCEFAKECSIPLLAGMFADSEICRNVF